MIARILLVMAALVGLPDGVSAQLYPFNGSTAGPQLPLAIDRETSPLTTIDMVDERPRTRIDAVHADIAVNYVNNAWRGQVRIDPNPNYTATVFTPSTATLVANPATQTTVPATPAFAFIGAAPGQPTWVLRQNLVPNQLYLGTSSQDTVPNSAPGGGTWANWLPGHPALTTPGPYVEYQVRAVRGPAGGDFCVWQNSGSGPIVFVSTELNGRDWLNNGATSNGNSIYGFVGSHIHYNWAFTVAGVYEIDIVPRTRYLNAFGQVQDLIALTPITFQFDAVANASPLPPFAPVPEPLGIIMAGVVGLLMRRRDCNSRR